MHLAACGADRLGLRRQVMRTSRWPSAPHSRRRRNENARRGCKPPLPRKLHPRGLASMHWAHLPPRRSLKLRPPPMASSETSASTHPPLHLPPRQHPPSRLSLLLWMTMIGALETLRRPRQLLLLRRRISNQKLLKVTSSAWTTFCPAPHHKRPTHRETSTSGIERTVCSTINQMERTIFWGIWGSLWSN